LPAGSGRKRASGLPWGLGIEPVDLDRALGLGALDTQVTRGGPNATFVAPATNRNLVKLTGFVVSLFLAGQPDPFCGLFIAFQTGQICPVQVLGDLPHTGASTLADGPIACVGTK
jgi:hypothetical protein